jgi:hypothetical protein
MATSSKEQNSNNDKSEDDVDMARLSQRNSKPSKHQRWLLLATTTPGAGDDRRGLAANPSQPANTPSTHR